MLFCHITSRVEGEPYPDLLAQRGGAGWPYVCFMNTEGQLIAKQRYSSMHEDGVVAFEATLASDVKKFFDLQAAAKTGDKKAKAAFFMKQFELDHLNAAAMKAALHKATFLSRSQRAEVRERLMEYRVRDCLAGLDTTKTESFGPYAKQLLQLHQTIGLPEGPAGMTPWYVILEDALAREDAKAFEMAFTALKAAGFGNRKRFVKLRTAQLAELQAKQKRKQARKQKRKQARKQAQELGQKRK